MTLWRVAVVVAAAALLLLPLVAMWIYDERLYRKWDRLGRPHWRRPR